MAEAYNTNVEALREAEYPMLKDAVYLDHAGTTLYSKSLMERFMTDMMSNLYGNPHSGSPSSQLSTNRIEDIRLKALSLFNADPEDFDLVFVANATAGIKLVMEAFRDQENGYDYGYHKDSHTSLVGVRENARASDCLYDQDIESWLAGSRGFVTDQVKTATNLFAYPAQSNMDGRRLPLSWPGNVRERGSSASRTYTLLDAAALVSTAQLDLSDASKAPDFTVLSFYKMFGFPDLGALIVRKDSGLILQGRKYFGGGTVDIVLSVKEQWHATKSQSLHEALEDGTLPFHSILALNAAIDVHREMFGSMDRVAQHTSFLAQKLFSGLESLRHGNGEPVCVMYSQNTSSNVSGLTQGPIVAFNLKNIKGAWVSNTEFEKLASVRNFHLRSGGLCNPGGVATSLNLEPWEMRRNFSAGFKCGSETDIYAGKITGIIRASFGAMSTIGDVESFLSFIGEFYVESWVPPISVNLSQCIETGSLVVESLHIYPIKSCGGFPIPPGDNWEVRPEGLAWDREWCLIHQGTGQALSQKRHPRMALIRPVLDFQEGVLRVNFHGGNSPGLPEEIKIPLSSNPNIYKSIDQSRTLSSRVCGDPIVTRTYSQSYISEFFSAALGVPCTLARFPAGGSGLSTRHAKAHMQKHQRPRKPITSEGRTTIASSGPLTPPDSDGDVSKRPILLSNESPILVINRSSLDSLNDSITKTGRRPASAAVFRANIILSSPNSQNNEPYSEDHWTSLQIGQQNYQMLGSCRRCHMICVDQETAEKHEEPFVTLAKTRRFDSKIFFGSHMCHVPSKGSSKESQYPSIRVGDVVTVEAGIEE